MQAGEAAFTNVLKLRVVDFAPSVDPAMVLATGATDLRRFFQGDELAGILQAYMAGLRVAFAIAIALGGCATIIAFFLPWKSIRPPKKELGGA